MTRRTLLVPPFAAALILAPSKLSGKMQDSPGPDGAFQVAGAGPPSDLTSPAGRGGS